LGALGASAWASVILLANPTRTPQYCNADEILEAVQLLPPSYRVYSALLERIINKTPMLKVLLEALELLKLLGPLEASELKTHDVF